MERARSHLLAMWGITCPEYFNQCSYLYYISVLEARDPNHPEVLDFYEESGNFDW